MDDMLMMTGAGLVFAFPLAFTFAFNMMRFRYVMDHEIHPFLEEKGIRLPGDRFVSSAVAESITAFDRAEDQAGGGDSLGISSERTPDGIMPPPKLFGRTRHSPSASDSIPPRLPDDPQHNDDGGSEPRPRPDAPSMLPLPRGPFPGADENQAAEARRLYETNDLHAADTWIENAGTHAGTRARRNAWRNETLQRFGLSHQPRHILQGINRRAWAIHTLHHTSPAEAYKQACKEATGNTANDETTGEGKETR